AVIRRFKTALPTRFEVPKTGRAVLSGCLITLDESTGKAQKIDRILINEDHPFSFD
ncbi:YmdB family metallophosphoesterase, partial [Listeria monocytogenes]|nr:YmdB family metallophosphoesterase [Listeria monocytogenes]